MAATAKLAPDASLIELVRRVGAMVGLALVMSPTLGAPTWGAVTFRAGVDRAPWPPGTDRVPLHIENGQAFLEATLRSPSGRSVSGRLVLDTGAPTLVIGAAAYRQLKVDTVVAGGDFFQYVRRSLASVELGSVRVPELAVGGVVDDSLFGEGVIGLLGPSMIQDRALVLDYEHQEWAMVPPRLAVVDRGAPGSVGNLGQEGRIGRSRAAYSAVLASDAVAVPFRLFEGGRILVDARACESDGSWCGAPLTLLFDTGASACVVFDDVTAERVSHVAHWPRLHDVAMHTMVGTSRMEATVLPTLRLIAASRPLVVHQVDVGLVPRRALPDIEGTLPERIHGLLGATFLERFRVVLDYGNQVLWLEPLGAGEPTPLRAPHVGIRLERRWGALRVAGVAPGSSAAQAGVGVGDEVIAIDGAKARTLDPGDAEDLLQGSLGSEVVLLTRHEGWERVLHLRRTSRH